MLNEFFQRLATGGIDLVALRAEIIPKPQHFDIRGELWRERIGASPRITGAAVFRKDRLVGWLGKQETRGLLWVMGRVRSGIIVIEHPADSDEYVGLEILRAKGSFRVKGRDGSDSLNGGRKRGSV